ncbi:hypothetical protein Tco_0721515 [Tanacetum coccineum]
MLNQGEYEMWKLRIEQYFQVQDYALWDVIENGNSFKLGAQTTTNADGSSTTLILGPVTADEKTQKKNDVKKRIMLLMAFPNEHLLTFNQYKDAKTLFATIQTRFGGNDATKKTQKTLLKQITNEVNTAYEVSTANTQVSTASAQDLKQIHEDDLEEIDLKSQLALLSMRTRRFFQKTGRTITINRSDTAGYDKSKKLLPKLCWLLMELVLTRAIWQMMKSLQIWLLWLFQNLRIEFNKSELNLATYKRGLASVEEQLVFYKKNEVLFCEQIAILKRDISYKDSEISVIKGLYSPPTLDLSNSGLEEYQQPKFEGYGPKTSKSVSEVISNEVRESPDAPLVEELVLNDNFDHVQANCNYHQRERVISENNYTSVNYNYSAKKAHHSAHRNMAPRAILMKTGLRPLNTARPVNTAHHKIPVHSARPMSHFSKSAQSTVKRPYQIKTALTNNNFRQKVNTAKGSFYTARPKAVNTARLKAVNTARPNSAVVNVVRANQVNVVKASAC